MHTQAEKGQIFADLHSQPDTFIIANPWDVGSARLMQGLGFKALATTSGGFAVALGKSDGEPTLAEKLAHCRAIAAATDIPLSADFEDGYATDPEDVATNVAALIDTGVVGCSIEDFSRTDKKMIELPLAVERIEAAVAVAAKQNFPFTLTARAEHLLRVGRDLDEVIQRLQAYAAAGADVLFAPYIGSLEDLATVTDAINKPFNLLGGVIPGATLADCQAAGAQRISIGGSLPYVAAKPIIAACETLLDNGSFDWLADMVPPKQITELMNKEPS